LRRTSRNYQETSRSIIAKYKTLINLQSSIFMTHFYISFLWALL
jgi:hypothetical protein